MLEAAQKRGHARAPAYGDDTRSPDAALHHVHRRRDVDPLAAQRHAPDNPPVDAMRSHRGQRGPGQHERAAQERRG